MTDGILGYIENVQLSDLDIECQAKVDTGADTSSIHADDIEEFKRDGQRWVRFHVHFKSQMAQIDQACEARVVEKRTITSSNGRGNRRYIIETTMTLGGKTFVAEVSLSHRGSMKYPMLIGRKAISGRFLVDVSRG
ncbi:MAG: ATP-dependent zinc protease [Pseudomonadota bacterium]|nr:ATP-dependent zinc protease [Pseudomonadota bacterium]